MITTFGMTTARRSVLLSGFMILVLGLAGCGSEEPPARPAPPVTVGKPTVSTVREYSIFTGFSRAVESADVVARVAGVLETVDFEPSSNVQKGDLLFTIEKTRYQALRDAAVASEASAEADLLRAETELKRVEKASKSRAVSEMDVDRARADRDMAIAAVSLAKANLSEAELNFSYTDVVSPLDGVVSRRLVDAGNLVGQDGPTKLTRVNKLKPIYVYFHAPESGVLNYLSARPEGGVQAAQQDHIKAQVALANESGYPHTGVIDYVDNEVDATTGTIEMRVVLENENRQIFPGLFVRVKVTGKKIPDAVQVPAVAIGTDLGGKYVLAVGENNIVEQIYVTPGEPQEEGLVHIKDGLDGTETIIVNGLMFARPGMPVTP
ncbi:MAG: efflux RND transporter periplasmic adaptor subunit, partial [Candidatus Krumholzibacteria bacterium]|nr:efflux RND transporter periplasmic adaptor subunit [Candidatus Krumholzibacteria bacterium]